MFNDKEERYFKNNGTEFNPDLIPTSNIYSTCIKNDDPHYHTVCNLTRADQEEVIFICFDYVPNSEQIDGEAILKEMEEYLNKKYGKNGERRDKR